MSHIHTHKHIPYSTQLSILFKVLAKTFVNSNLIATIGTGVVNILEAINAKWYTTKRPKQPITEKAQQEQHQYKHPSECSNLVSNRGDLLCVADVTIIIHGIRTKL